MAKVTKEKRAIKAADVVPESKPETVVEKSAPKVIKAVAPKADVSVSAPKASTGLKAGAYIATKNFRSRGAMHRVGSTVELSHDEATLRLAQDAVKKA